MNNRAASGILMACLLMSWSAYAGSLGPSGAVEMSPELRQLFQAEMRELLKGTRLIAESLPVANWDAIGTSAATMRDSYVLAKKLTGAQEAELSKLPEQFKALDEAFHLRADRLVAAAKARDGEGVAFQLSRLLETCVSCHATYAVTQFPGFEAQHGQAHRH